MSRDVVIPKGMESYYNDFHFAPARKDGDRLFCSGQIGVGEGYKCADDPETQFTQAFEHCKTTLEAAGASFDDVVEMTTFHVGLQQHINAFMKVKDRYMKDPYSAWTAIGITELAFPGALVEIKLTVRLKS